jgi:hypothetical protein
MAKFIPKPKPGSAVSPLPRPSSYFRGGAGGLIPGETSSGQTMLFNSGLFKKPTPRPMSEAHLKRKVMAGIKKDAKPTPPFSGSRPADTTSGMPAAKVAARREELAAKKAKARNTRAKMARGEATRQTYRNRYQKSLQKATKPYDVPGRYGPNTKSEQYVDDLFGV